MIFVSFYTSYGALFCDQTASQEVFRPSSWQLFTILTGPKTKTILCEISYFNLSR